MTIEKRALDPQHARGLILRYSDRAKIIVSPQLNTCWTRFVVCKELMHLLVDLDPKSYTTDPVLQLISVLMSQLPNKASITSEAYAFVAALEYMLPFDFRPKDCNGETSATATAERFKVPREYVEFFYSSPFRLISQSLSA